MHGADTDRERAAEQHGRAAACGPGRRARAQARAPGHGSSPTNARPITTRMNPAISLGLLVDRARDRGSAGTEDHEHDREPDDERDARDHDPAARAALAEPLDLDRRDRREVAGHERQHARRDDGDQAGEEGDRELLEHRLSRRSPRAPDRPAARGPGRASARPERARPRRSRRGSSATPSLRSPRRRRRE